uniref:Uncharacterized protein n=1 Tax=Zea mays TaxID=4577 RepID=B6U2P0_MAIZE|nr:hypothetical protein [Zea mays]
MRRHQQDRDKLLAGLGEITDDHTMPWPALWVPFSQEKNRWFKWSHTSRSSIRSRWRFPVDLRQG